MYLKSCIFTLSVLLIHKQRTVLCEAMEEIWEEFAANDEMSSPSEDRSPHYKLAWGILAGIISLTLVKLIYIKKYHRVKSQAKEHTFTPEINTREVLSKHGTMDREVPFKVSICEGVPPIGKDATGLISWDDTKIISNDSAALHPKYTTQADGFFDSTGGVLSTALHSDVQIIIGNGAIAEGDLQRLFFGVICDETAPLQDILEGNTLISPVIECGPHDICLLKPVEIILPHCLDLEFPRKTILSRRALFVGSKLSA